MATETTCDRCKRKRGPRSERWSTVTLQMQGATDPVFVRELCDRCSDGVFAAIAKPKRLAKGVALRVVR